MTRILLTGSQRKRLRGLAHGLEASVQIGGAGLTENVSSNLNHALEHHELIKVRFVGSRDSKKEICGRIEQELGCGLAGLIGHVAIFYRPAPVADNRRIDLS